MQLLTFAFLAVPCNSSLYQRIRGVA